MSLYQGAFIQLCLESERTQQYKKGDRCIHLSHSIDPFIKENNKFQFKLERGPDLIKSSLLLIDLAHYILLPDTTIFDIIQSIDIYDGDSNLIDSISGSFIRDWLLLTAPNEYQKYLRKYYGRYIIPIPFFFHESDTPLLINNLISPPRIIVSLDFSSLVTSTTTFDRIYPEIPVFAALPPEMLEMIKKFLVGELKLQLFYKYVIIETPARDIFYKNAVNNTSTISQHQSFTFPINGRELITPINLSGVPSYVIASINSKEFEIEHIRISTDNYPIISIDPIESMYTKIREGYNTDPIADNIFLKIFDEDSLIDLDKAGHCSLHVQMKKCIKGRINVHFLKKNELMQYRYLTLKYMN